MAAPSGKIALEWCNLSYVLPPSKKGQPGKVVLRGAFGRCEPGELMALLGPSGSGKSSLLNALAGRTPMAAGAELAGTVLVEADGKAFFSSCLDMPSISAYVEQDDALFALSTVKETLSMVARLRMPELSSLERDHRVKEVIGMLGLSPVANSVVGSDMPGQRGISGGERKRVHLGLELLHKPKLIFADEPTSGLDSFQAQNVMQTLKELAQAGHTVVCSIHQPRSSIYQLVDKVVLLAEGRIAYCGPGREFCSEHFARIGFPVPSHFNDADHYLDVISVDYRTPETEAQTRQVVEKVVAGCPAPVATLTKPQPVGAVLPRELSGQRKVSVPFFAAFGLLCSRTWRELTRDKATLGTKYAANCFFTALFAWIYFRMDMSQTSLQNRTGICFFMAMNQGFGSVIGISQVIPRQLKVVSRERAAKLYDVLPFYVANFVCTVPLELLPQVVFGAVLYTLTGLRPGWNHMLTYVGVLVLENFAGIAVGMTLSSSFTSVEQAPQVAPMVVILFLMFSGFLLNQDSIPKLLSPLKHISFIRYAFQALAVNELRGNDGFECNEGIFRARCLQGDDWLKHMSFEDVSIAWNCCVLLLEVMIFNVLAFQILKQKRPSFMKPWPKPVNNPLMGA